MQSEKNEKILALPTELADMNGLLTFCLFVCTGLDFAYYEFRFSIASSLFLENDIKVSDDICKWRRRFLELLMFLCPSSDSEKGSSEWLCWDGINFA